MARMTPMQLLAVVAMADEHDYAVMSYSGRGMMGERCLAFDINHENLYQFGLAVAEAFKDDLFPTDLFQYARPQTDSLGMNEVVYFTHIELTEADLAGASASYPEEYLKAVNPVEEIE
jgi:hypothetical protein